MDISSEFSAALFGFNQEAAGYYRGISDSVAQEYAMEYTKMIENRAKGLDSQSPRVPAGLFEPSWRLIRSNLECMCVKYFPRKC